MLYQKIYSNFLFLAAVAQNAKTIRGDAYLFAFFNDLPNFGLIKTKQQCRCPLEDTTRSLDQLFPAGK